MGKKIFLLLLVLMSLASCKYDNKVIEESSSDLQEGDLALDYSDFEFINWLDIFNLSYERYYVYIFSSSCSHCNNIKSYVLNYLYYSDIPSKLLEFSKEVQISEDISNTLGCNSLDDLYILGTPTLLLVDNNYLSVNLAGETSILSYINLF